MNHKITAAVGAVLAFGAMLLAYPEADQYDEFSQASFPCQEDEVLTYAPQFGPERVGCLNIEEVRRGN